MKKFVLNLSGFESQPMLFRELRRLYNEGAISRHTPCRARGSSGWSTVDDMFPMLKHEPRSKLCIAGWTGPMRLSAKNLLVIPSSGGMPRLVSSAMLF